MVREPNLLPTLVMAVLTNAIDTEGNLPEELTAHIKATIRLKGHDPIELRDTAERPALHRARWGRPRSSARSPRSSTCWSATRWSRSGSRGSNATSRSTRGERWRPSSRSGSPPTAWSPARASRHSSPSSRIKGERQTVEIVLPLPDDLEEGQYEASLSDMTNSLRRRLRNEPSLMEPRDLDGILRAIRFQTEPTRTALYLHIPLPDRAWPCKGSPSRISRGASARSSRAAARARNRRSVPT